MTEYLYVFVDEGGSAANDRYFVTTACWYRSTEHWREAGDELVGQLRRWYATETGGSLPPEIRGAKFADRVVERSELFEKLVSDSYSAPNITVSPHSPPVGTEQYPVRYTWTAVDARVARSLLGETVPRPDAPRSLRTTSLVTVLRPLWDDQIPVAEHDTVRIGVDGSMWNDAVQQLDRGSTVLPVSDVDADSRDSRKTPGIQLADIAANTVWHHVVDERFPDAVAQLEEVRLG